MAIVDYVKGLCKIYCIQAKPFIDFKKGVCPASVNWNKENFGLTPAKKYLPRHICDLGYHNTSFKHYLKLSILN